MSKMDNLRAMREARYAEMAKRSASPSGQAKAATKKPPVAPPVPPTPEPEPSAAESPAVESALCGHRNMSGRTCTREQGHAAKSHRYS